MIEIFSEHLKRLTQYNNFGFVSYISLNKINIPHRNMLNTTTQQSAVISTYYQTLAIKQIWIVPFYKAYLRLPDSAVNQHTFSSSNCREWIHIL